MKNDLLYLLFEKPVKRKDGSFRKLFKFQSTLAQVIVEVSPAYSNKTANGIRPYLNQTLKPGGEPYEKPMSEDMKEAIVLAIRSRLHQSDPLYDDTRTKVERAYNVLKEIEDDSTFISNDELFHELLTWQANSNRTVIFNRKPSEVRWRDQADVKNSNNSGELINLMVKNLFKNFDQPTDSICKLAFEDKQKNKPKAISQPNKQYFYRFCVPSFNVAKELWSGLLKFIIDEVLNDKYDQPYENKQKAASRLLEWFNFSKTEDEKNVQFIKVYKVDGLLLTTPLVYFECGEGIESSKDGIKSFEMLFNLNYHNGTLQGIGKSMGEDLLFWKEHVYYPLFWSDSKKFGMQEIMLSKSLYHIKRISK